MATSSTHLEKIPMSYYYIIVMYFLKFIYFMHMSVFYVYHVHA